MATCSSSTKELADSLLQSLNNKDRPTTKTADETPAKRVKISHELVTPASSQSSLPGDDHPTPPSPTMNPTSHSPHSLATPMSKNEIRNLLLKEAEYDCDSNKNSPKRSHYLSWDDFFMSVAYLSAMRSKDPHTPTGACIVDEEYRVIGIGYNGFPRGCSDNVLPWTNNSTAWLHTPNPYMCHAETNAILNKCSDTVAGARMYVPHFPCK